MPELAPVSTSNAADMDAFATTLVLGKVFQEVLKKPESSDDSDEPHSVGVTNTVNQQIGITMAQSVTGFGL